MLETIIILLLKTKYNIIIELWAFENVFSDKWPGYLRQFRTFSHFEAAITRKPLEKPG